MATFQMSDIETLTLVTPTETTEMDSLNVDGTVVWEKPTGVVYPPIGIFDSFKGWIAMSGGEFNYTPTNSGLDMSTISRSTEIGRPAIDVLCTQDFSTGDYALTFEANIKSGTFFILGEYVGGNGYRTINQNVVDGMNTFVIPTNATGTFYRLYIDGKSYSFDIEITNTGINPV